MLDCMNIQVISTYFCVICDYKTVVKSCAAVAYVTYIFSKYFLCEFAFICGLQVQLLHFEIHFFSSFVLSNVC
jgi:hypothetical protein